MPAEGGDRRPSADPPATDSRPVSPGPFTLVIFGASGDLARRKLVPALYDLHRDGRLAPGFAVLGYARRPMTDEAFRRDLREAAARFSRGGPPDEKSWDAFARRLAYVSGAYDDVRALRAVGERLRREAGVEGRPAHALFYLATPPSAFAPIGGALGASGLSRPEGRGAPWARVIVEKPFGRDLAGARALNAALLAAFAEDQVFRIDHYLGKEAVQNILVLRFANSVFEPLWNQKYVDHVQITVSETVGVEGRGATYEQAGALRDMVQNHLMHLVSLVAMEPPLALEAGAVRDEKVKVLRSLRPLRCEDVPGAVVRARYAAGSVHGEAARGYLEEPGVPPGSATETYVAMRLFIDNWRWAGVPFYLRTGKRMPVRVSEVSVHFKPVPQVLFGAPPGRGPPPNVLAIRIQPNEGVSMRFEVKVPGPAMRLEPFQMDFGYADAFDRRTPDAYERLLLDAALGDSTLFTRGDEVEAAWAFVDPVLEGCRSGPGAAVAEYAAGSWGPPEADALLAADGREWVLVRRPARAAPGGARGKERP